MGKNDIIIWEFSSETDEQLNVDFGMIAQMVDSYSYMAENLYAADIGRDTPMFGFKMQLHQARQGSLIIDFGIVIEWMSNSEIVTWMNKNREAIADYATIFSFPVALLAWLGAGRVEHEHSRDDPDFARLVQRVGRLENIADLRGEAVSFVDTLKMTSAAYVRILSPGAPALIISANDNLADEEQPTIEMIMQGQMVDELIRRLSVISSVLRIQTSAKIHGNYPPLTKVTIWIKKGLKLKEMSKLNDHLEFVAADVRRFYFP